MDDTLTSMTFVSFTRLSVPWEQGQDHADLVIPVSQCLILRQAHSISVCVCVCVSVSVSVSVSVCSKALSDLQAYVHLMGASQVTQWVKKPPAMQETQKM